MTKQVPITKGLFVLVDDEDFDRVMARRWQAKPAKHKRAEQKTWYAQTQFNRKTVLMHRWILGVQPGQEVDHINRNGLDNRRSNLRICSKSENNANRGFYDPKSGFRGVYVQGRRFVARISINGVRVHLGIYADEISAAKAYDEAAKRQYGQFATLNFPESANERAAA